ncbi:MAG: nicotinate (nicotinamide) nucleotide adenylyltransferase [Lachnospiraceae bacterium]|nr:nicotinate (nicotinamide) nucleotide adenylyltransferase [Lachnospiraceae bacterium]
MEVEKTYKAALYGGTFDPFHKGHLRVTEEVFGELCPDRMIVIPTGHPYMKEREGRQVTPAEHRIGMIRAALEETQVPWEISRAEVDLDTTSYTVNTLQVIRRQLAEELGEDRPVALYFVCGSDVLLTIHTWYRHEEILQQVILTVVPRGDEDPERILEAKRDLEERYGARVQICGFTGPAISSTGIREDIAAQASALPEGVLAYIREHHLYGF